MSEKIVDVDAYRRLISDVCNVFTEVTGAIADPKREGSSIVPWAREFGWETYDFRLVIEFEFSDARRREFLNQPGRMNLRAIFNPARRDLLLDTHADLKRAKEIQKKAKAHEADLSSDIRTTSILMTCCGRPFDVKYCKVPATNSANGYLWKKSNVEEYEKHLTECFRETQVRSLMQFA